MACTETNEFTIQSVVNRLGVKRPIATTIVQRLEREEFLMTSSNKGKNSQSNRLVVRLSC